MTDLSSASDNSLERYIQRVMEIQQIRANLPLTKADLNEIALELQLDEEDMKMIEEQFRGHFDRGMGFLKFKNWKSATTELEQALDLKPYHEGTLILLASAYQKWFYEVQDEQMRLNALSLARKVIHINTQNEDAYRIITDLEKVTGRRVSRKSKRRKTKTTKVSRRMSGSPAKRKRNNIIFMVILGFIILSAGGPIIAAIATILASIFLCLLIGAGLFMLMG